MFFTHRICCQSVKVKGSEAFIVEKPSLPYEPHDAPLYDETTLLMPTTPSKNDRYNRNHLAHVETADIPAGLHSSTYLDKPRWLPEGWSMNVHPEGSPFYIKRHEHFWATTDVIIHNEQSASRIIACIDYLQIHIQSIGYKLPDDCELYIAAQRGSTGEGEGCRYYFADHINRTVFWIQDTDADVLGFPDVASGHHLKYVLEEQYWNHYHDFPHRPLPPGHRSELLAILRHGRGDQLTSASSTFPYSAEQCADFINLLTADEKCDTAYMACLIARLWSIVAYNRFITLYGEDYPRLSRSDWRLRSPQPTRGILFKIFDVLMLAGPEQIRHELESIFVDQVIFRSDWEKFIRHTLNGLKQSCATGSIVLLTNTLLLNSLKTLVSPSAALVSEAVAFCGLVAGASLFHSYANRDEWETAYVAQHLCDIHHPVRGFASTAIALSLPRALVYWSMICTGAHMVLMAANLQWMVAKVIAVLVLAILAYALLWTAWTIRGAFGYTHDSGRSITSHADAQV